MNIKQRSVFNAITLAIHCITAYLSQYGVLNGKSIKEVSDKYASLFTPAGFTFAIWGLIYLSLGAFVIYHIIKAYRENEQYSANQDLKKLGNIFALNNLATIAWLFVWTYELLFLSVLLIIIQLITLIMMNIRLRIHDAAKPIASKAFTQFPLSIYFGWTTIATIANISVYLKSIKWSGWGISEINWTITMIAIAVMITVWVINRKRNVFFGLAVIWALYGIIEKRTGVDPTMYHPVILVAWGGIGIVASATLFGLIRNLREKKEKPLVT